jgi:hypothetical protein
MKLFQYDLLNSEQCYFLDEPALDSSICRTNSNQFEFVRQIAATKFCRSDNDFHMSHEAICCSNLSR